MDKDKEKPELMKPVRVFAAIEISRSRGYEAIQRGEIPFVRIAGQIRIPRIWVEGRVKEALEQSNSPVAAATRDAR